MLDILYLVPNLADAAVWRRVRMLEAGGATVRTAGFRRKGTVVPHDAHAIELGQTEDSRFVQRLLAIAAAWPSVGRRIARGQGPDVVIARNLEMLALAHRVAAALPNRPPVVYECLDIHRLLLRKDAIGIALRGVEQRLAAKSALLLTSSPGFVREYFQRIGELPVVVVENKVFDNLADRGRNPVFDNPDGRLRIGWFGALRCRTSLESLARFTRAIDGRFEVVLRGYTASVGFDGFIERANAEPHLRYEGPYNSPGDLARIYGEVHFAWAIDLFEDGFNSRWLLPNRLYEGCLHGAVPIAVEGTETAAWLRRHGLGVVLPDPTPDTLIARLGGLTRDEIAALAGRVRNADETLFRCTGAECAALVGRLAGTRTRSAPVVATVAA